MYAKYVKLRNKKGVSDYRVSQETGISKTALSEWGKGKYELKLEKLKLLAKYFDVPITYFIS